MSVRDLSERSNTINTLDNNISRGGGSSSVNNGKVINGNSNSYSNANNLGTG